jgi:hypothetical protein
MLSYPLTFEILSVQTQKSQILSLSFSIKQVVEIAEKAL